MCNTIKKIQLEHEERGTLQISFDAVDETRFHSTRGRRDETTREDGNFFFFFPTG